MTQWSQLSRHRGPPCRPELASADGNNGQAGALNLRGGGRCARRRCHEARGLANRRRTARIDVARRDSVRAPMAAERANGRGRAAQVM